MILIGMDKMMLPLEDVEKFRFLQLLSLRRGSGRYKLLPPKEKEKLGGPLCPFHSALFPLRASSRALQASRAASITASAES